MISQLRHMSTLVVLILILMLSLPCYAQKPVPHTRLSNTYVYTQEADSSSQTYWIIKGTEADYSAWFKTSEEMGLNYFACDTTGDDSVNLKLYLQMCSYPTDTDLIVTVDSLILPTTCDSVPGIWDMTEFRIPGMLWSRIKIQGGADNEKESGSLVKSVFDGYNNP